MQTKAVEVRAWPIAAAFGTGTASVVQAIELKSLSVLMRACLKPGFSLMPQAHAHLLPCKCSEQCSEHNQRQALDRGNEQNVNLC